MKNKKGKNKTRKRILILGFLCVGFCTFFLITLANYWMDIINLYKEKKTLDNELVTLKEKEGILKKDVEKLQDPDYVARYARERYLYSKDGEYIIRIP
jgi:cell division protein DivIC